MALAARGALLRDARARARGAAVPAPHAVPARPRPDRAREGVPAADAQDAGLRRSRRRPLPHASDAHARDDGDLARGGASAAAERGPRRGDRARPRSRAHAVRPRRRGGARRGCSRIGSAGASGTTSTRLRVVDVLERDGRGLNLTAEVRDGILNHTGPNEPDDARGEDRPARRPRRLHQPRHRRRRPRGRARPRRVAAGGDRAARPDRLAAHRRARPRPGRDLGRAQATSARARRSARRCSRCGRFMFDRVYLGEAARAEHAPRPRDRDADLRPPDRAWRFASTRWSTTSPG